MRLSRLAVLPLMLIGAARTATAQSVIWSDDFESDRGWTVQTAAESSLPSWQRGVPTVGAPPSSGSRVWATNLAGSFNANERSFIVSPAIDCRNRPGLWLRFESWFDAGTQGATGLIEVRSSPSAPWVPAGQMSARVYPGLPAPRFRQLINMSSFAGSATVQIRFGLQSRTPADGAGWSLDDVALLDARPEVPGRNVALLSRTVGSGYSNQRFSNLWGYAGPDGREYGLIGRTDGTLIVDLTNPTAPRQAAFIPGVSSSWRELKTYGGYGYVVSEGTDAGLQIIDLRSLPQTATLAATDRRYFTTAHTVSVDSAGFLYVVGARRPIPNQTGAEPVPGALIFDLNANPTEPPLVATYVPEPHTGGRIVARAARLAHGDDSLAIASGTYIHDVHLRGNRLFTFTPYDQVDVVDITDRRAPKPMAHLHYAEAQYSHSGWTTDDRSHLLVGDEAINGGGSYLRVMDLSDLAVSRQVAVYAANPQGSVHNVQVRGRYAYVSCYTEGLRVLDMVDPTNPVEVGSYDTYDGPPAVFAGNWGVYTDLPSGTILASDMQSGLYAFRFTPPTATDVPGTATPTAFRLLHAAPNPFNPATTIRYELATTSRIQLQVFDMLGRRVQTLVDDTQPSGPHSAAFDGEGLPSGVYWVRLTVAGSGNQTMPVSLVR